MSTQGNPLIDEFEWRKVLARDAALTMFIAP